MFPDIADEPLSERVSEVIERLTGQQIEILALSKLNWAADGLLTLLGCNTGLAGKRGWTPASVFAKAQGVSTIGQAGYAYFSTSKTSYVKIGSGQSIYLWAYNRGKNAAFGAGARMAGVTFAP